MLSFTANSTAIYPGLVPSAEIAVLTGERACASLIPSTGKWSGRAAVRDGTTVSKHRGAFTADLGGLGPTFRVCPNVPAKTHTHTYGSLSLEAIEESGTLEAGGREGGQCEENEGRSRVDTVPFVFVINGLYAGPLPAASVSCSFGISCFALRRGSEIRRSRSRCRHARTHTDALSSLHVTAK